MITIIRKYLPILCIGLFLATWILPALGVHLKTDVFIYWNRSESEPIGLYLAVPGAIHTGDKVVMRVPEDMKEYCYGRGWMKQNEPMLKTVYALPGDSYQITDNEITVKGKFVGPVYDIDQKGLPLPKQKGMFTVKENNFLPIASYKPNSFDGRYFGEISQNHIISKVVPILIL